MDCDRNSVRDCKMRNESGWTIDSAKKGIALADERHRAEARAKIASANRRDSCRRRHCSDRQSAAYSARRIAQSTANPRRHNTFWENPAWRPRFYGSLRREHMRLPERNASGDFSRPWDEKYNEPDDRRRRARSRSGVG